MALAIPECAGSSPGVGDLLNVLARPLQDGASGAHEAGAELAARGVLQVQLSLAAAHLGSDLALEGGVGQRSLGRGRGAAPVAARGLARASTAPPPRQLLLLLHLWTAADATDEMMTTPPR
eukprot:CAMPEP_0197574848 /NCGR_PEP_ID=MMETSP1326-20131121/442_1 /TAXON_ID=1155430 /ORGANISM="Genus nov. species nov., Strain RCC2288" /LENGTH=120 /DNA_ID=CAMNT_0043137501 /DNA_START=160 /DNA_END=519 /DNA_ORIENTATION=+